jgi:hypothetical protein
VGLCKASTLCVHCCNSCFQHCTLARSNRRLKWHTGVSRKGESISLDRWTRNTIAVLVVPLDLHLGVHCHHNVQHTSARVRTTAIYTVGKALELLKRIQTNTNAWMQPFFTVSSPFSTPHADHSRPLFPTTRYTARSPLMENCCLTLS